jgi:hypothetical protein
MPVSASPTGKHKAIAFEVFSPRLITRDLADSVWIISMPKINMLIMYKEVDHIFPALLRNSIGMEQPDPLITGRERRRITRKFIAAFSQRD